jgi:ethanolamine utilization protein EutQ
MMNVFKGEKISFVRYLGHHSAPERGDARIARLVRPSNGGSLDAGLVIYKRITVDWNLQFDEFITVVEGSMRIHSSGLSYDLVPGDVAWIPAHTPFTYEVHLQVIVSYVRCENSASRCPRLTCWYR